MKNPVAQLARECLSKCDDNWERAARMLRKRVEKNPEAKEYLFDKAANQLCWYEIRHQARIDRTQMMSSKPGSDSSLGLERIAETHERELLKFTLRGGLWLGDARQDDLDGEIEFHGKLARTIGIKERWLRLIRDALPNNRKTVSSVFTNEKLEVLHEEAEKQFK